MVNHSYSIDLLRGVAAFGIVACHLNLGTMTDGAWTLRWYGDMFVGLFAALSGYLMAVTMKRVSDAEGTWAAWWRYARKRMSRILSVYVFWSLVYVAFGFAFDLLVRHGINPKWSSEGFIYQVVFWGDAATHLWFPISLLYGQLVFGLAFLVFYRANGLTWMALGALLLGIPICLGGVWLAYYPLRVFAFLVTGYGLGRLSQTSVKWLGLWTLILVAALAIHFFAATAIHAFLRDWLVVVPLLIVAVGVELPKRLLPVAAVLGATSMGVFLVHPLFAAGFRLLIWKLRPAPYGIFPVAVDWLAVWLVAFASTLVMLRIPLMRKFVR